MGSNIDKRTGQQGSECTEYSFNPYTDCGNHHQYRQTKEGRHFLLSQFRKVQGICKSGIRNFLAGFKLMKTMAEHFNRVNTSTLFGNYNQGQVMDESRYSIQQKIPQQFGNGKKLEYGYNNYDFKPEGDARDVGNFTANQLQQVGYKYG